MTHHTPRDLLAHLDESKIDYQLFQHPPLHTVEDALRERGDLEGSYVKNLYLRDRKGRMSLVTCLNRREVNLQRLRREMGLKRLSFASPAELDRDLGVQPGSVSPLALINAQPESLNFYADLALQDQPLTNLHPLTNEMTVQLQWEIWVDLCARWGFKTTWINFDALPEEGA